MKKRRKRPQKSGKKDEAPTKTLILLTAITNLITALLVLIDKLTG